MPTTNEVRDALSDLSTVEFQTSDSAGGVRVAINEAEAGQFFKTLRVRGFNAKTRRFGDTLVAHIEAEKSGGLRDLLR